MTTKRDIRGAIILCLYLASAVTYGVIASGCYDETEIEACEMANTPRIIQIAPFRNPITQRPQGAGVVGGQLITVTKPVYAFAIAADSPVDVVDLWINSNTGIVDRIRVSAEAPWFGYLDPGVVKHVFAVPVRAFDPTLSGQHPDAIGDAQYPFLKLAVYDDCAPNQLPTVRAPMAASFVETTVAANETNTIYFASCGRERVSWAFRIGGFAGGCTQVTIYIVGIDYHYDAAGNVTSTSETLLGPTVINVDPTEDSYVYEGPAFDIMGMVLDPDAGTYTYGVQINAED